MEQGYRNPALPTRLGDEYAATWTDASTFVVTLTRSATPALPPPLHRGLGIGVVGDVRTQPTLTLTLTLSLSLTLTLTLTRCSASSSAAASVGSGSPTTR